MVFLSYSHLTLCLRAIVRAVKPLRAKASARALSRVRALICEWGFKSRLAGPAEREARNAYGFTLVTAENCGRSVSQD